MLPLLMVAGLAAALRLLGGKGRGPGVTWRAAVLHAVSVTTVATSLAVLTPMRVDMVRMVPDSVPHPERWVIAMGGAQLLSGAGMAVPGLRPIAAGLLAAVVCAKLPANFKAAREGLTIRGPLQTPPWMRIPDAIAWLALIAWSSGVRSRSVERLRAPRGHTP